MVKPFDAFHKSKAKKDGHTNCCKECRKVVHKEHYEANKQAYKNSARDRQKQLKLEIDEIKAKTACADCGKNYHPIQMDFDHVSSNKDENVSLLVRSGSRNKVLAEIEKCEIVCANCHRMRTFLRGYSSIG